MNEKNIPNNRTGIPLAHYRERFAAADPAELSAKSGLPYEDGAFRFAFLSRPVELRWPEMTVRYIDDGAMAGDAVTILLSRLALEGAIVPGGGKMLAYTEMPWGTVYEAQFRGRCISRMAFTYGAQMQKFIDCCTALGGTAVKGGDAAFDLPFLPGLTVRLLLWEGAEEFPPSAQILFSDNFPAAFTAEDMAVVGDVILNGMKGRW